MKPLFFESKLLKINTELTNKIPFILEKIETFHDLKPMERKQNINPVLFGDEINNAAKIIKSLRDFDCTLLNKNLRSLTTGTTRRINSGYYDIIDNHMKVYSSISVPHETFHIASSYYDKERNVIVSGFSYSFDKIVFGRAFTEGFTELYAQEYFNIEEKITSYEYFIKYAKLFREIFSMIPIQKYYSQGNLYGLLVEIEKLGIKKEETLAFIYLLSRFEPFNIGVIEECLNMYLEDFKRKVKKRIE